MNAPRRLLMIAPYFPPRRRVGALRPFKFAMHLREFGWHPTVVCVATPGERLTEREREHLEGIEVVALDSPLDRTRGGGSSSDQSAGSSTSALATRTPNLPPTLRASWRRVTDGARRLADRADHSVPVDTWWPVFRFHQPRLQGLVQQGRFDAVWSTGDPWSGHVLARSLAKGPGVAVATLGRLFGRDAASPGLPWVADFRDPWTLCAVRNTGKPWPTRVVDEQVERSIFSSADAITFTAKTATDRYARHYEGLRPNITTIVNGFDATFFGLDAVAASTDALGGWSRLPEETFELLFFGRFRTLSPARPVIAMLAQMRRIAPESFERVRVRSVGTLNAADEEAAREAGVETAFETIEAVPYERALERLRQADVLLVSSGAERDDMIPAKLWDYLPAGRPVLSLAANDEVGDVLARTGRGRHVGSEAPLAAAKLVISAVEARDRSEAVPWVHPETARREGIDAYEARALTRRLAALLDETLAR